MHKNFTLLLLTCLIASRSFSQTGIQEIVITENRLSDKTLKESNSTKLVVTKDEIQTLSVKNIADILHYVAGIQVNQRGNNNAQTDIKINGGTFEQTLILINGHPILDPQTGHHFMNLPITQNDIEQIEILTGPQAYSYGINGITGAINIITKSGNRNEVSINAVVGSNFQKDTATNKNYHTSNVQVGISNATKISKQYLSLSTDIGNGFMYNTSTQNYKLFYTNDLTILKGNKISLMASYINNEFGANGFYSPPYDVNSFEKVQTFFGAIKHEKRLSTHWKTKTNISVRTNNDLYIFKKENPSYYENTHKTKSIFANTNLNYNYKNGEISFGLFVNNQQIRSTNLDTFERNNIGLFIENNVRITSKLSSTMGLFVSNNNKFGANILPGIEVGYQANTHLKYYTTIGSANRIPTYTDLYYKGPSNIGNDKLLAEKSIGFDIGVRYNTKKILLNIYVFDRQVKELIDWTKPSTAIVWQPSNFGLQTVKGININTSYNFKNSTTFSMKTFSVSYQYLDLSIENKNKLEVSKYSLDYFKHQLVAYATINITKQLAATGSIRYQNRFNYIDYTIADMRINYTTKYVRLFADINNITNEKYIEANAQPMPSRWLSLGVNLKFNTQNL